MSMIEQPDQRMLSQDDGDDDGSGWQWDEQQGCWICRPPRPPHGGRPPKPRPPCPPGPPGPFPPRDRPGVTDGQPAQPGMVGEAVRTNTIVKLVQPQLQYPISALVLTPGDWQVEAWAEFDIQMRGAQFHLDPAQPGFQGGMTGRAMLAGSALFDAGHYIYSEPTPAVFATPTLVAFTLILWDPVWNSGQMQVQFACAARRMR